MSSHDWRALIERLPLAVYIDRLDEWSSNVYTSPQLEAILGYTAEEWASDDQLLLKILHPEDRERVMAAHLRSCETGEPFRMEYRVIARDGRVVWFLDQATVVASETGAPAFHHGFYLDITERKELERALATSTEELGRQKRYFESLLEISPVAIVTTDVRDVVTSWNPAAETLFGYTQAEALGHQIDDLVATSPQLRAEAASVTREALAERRVKAFTKRTHKDGSLIDVELLAAPVVLHGKPVGTYAIYHDVREIKRAEERYRTLVEGLPLVTYVREPSECAASIYVSPQVEALLGYSPEECRAADMFGQLLHPDDRGRVLAERARALEEGESRSSFEYRLVARDGRTVWIDDEALVVRDQEGKALYIQGFQVDVSERKHAENALRESEQRFRAMFEEAPIGVAWGPVDPSILVPTFLRRPGGRSPFRWNRAYREMLGYSEEELQTLHFSEYIHPDDQARQLALYRDLLAGHVDRYELEMRYIGRDGRVIWAHVVDSIVRDDEAGTLFGLTMVEDITQRKAAEDGLRRSEAEVRRQKQYFESLVELSPTAIVTLDLDGSVRSWNPAAENLFGYSPREAIGRNVDDLLARSEPMHAEALEANAKARSGGKVHLTTQRTRKDGSLVDVEVQAAPVFVGAQQVGMYALYHDIAELLRARQEAEAATEAKSAFLASMSHELRTPLNAVIGMTELLLGTDLTPEQRELADVVRTSGDALLDVINEILDFSKIEAHRLDLERQPFVVRDCIETALEIVGSSAAKKGLEVACLVDPGTPAAIVGDRARLGQILVNLLANAVKFTEHGEVVLTVEPDVARRQGDRVHVLHFTVRDTGIGISADRIDRLFESFSQGDASTTRRYGGTGLGLAISKRLCELMGGEMSVESEPGKGSAFHFTVVAEAAPSLQKPPIAAALRGKRLLVVDDNAVNREVVMRQARTWEMVPRETGSPIEALEWIRRGDPLDVVVLDMQMPEMDGLTLAREIRRDRAADALPLVMLTSLGRQRRDRESGGDFAAFLTKPIKASQLYNALMAAIGAEPAGAGDAADHRPSGAVGARAQLRVLLVEDNAVNQQLALRMLDKLGHRAELAVNGLEALEALRGQRYDVVLMDVEMPEMDGLEASRCINREWPPDERPRIIAMTANAMQGYRDVCLAAGMDDYLSKPIHVDELAQALDRSAPRAAGTPLATESDVLDPETLDQLRDATGDPAFVAEIIATFVREAPALLETIRGALEHDEAEELRRAAHTLKSNGRTFGATRLAGLCQELEAMAGAEPGTGGAELLSQLEMEYPRVEAALRAAGQDMA